MHLARLQRPLQRAAASNARPLGTVLRPTTTATTTATTATTLEERFAHLRITSPNAAGSAVEGRRYASVKAQGAYKIKSKKTIPKKMGAKKTGGRFRSRCHCAVVGPSGGYPKITLLNMDISDSRPICYPRQHHLQAAGYHMAPW